LWKVYNGSSTSGNLLQEYVFHPTEERVLIKKEYSSGVLQDTTYYVSKEFVRVVNTSGTYDFTYVYHEGQLIAEKDAVGNKKYYHPDHLGSTSLVTDSSGSLVESTSYEPFGTAIAGGSASRYLYEGKEFDSVTGQYDFHFRMQGIAGAPPYQQPDSLLPNVYDPQQLNRYAFERNNPWKNTDEAGHLAEVLANPYLAIITIVLIIAAYLVLGKGMGDINKENNVETANPAQEATSQTSEVKPGTVPPYRAGKEPKENGETNVIDALSKGVRDTPISKSESNSPNTNNVNTVSHISGQISRQTQAKSGWSKTLYTSGGEIYKKGTGTNKGQKLVIKSSKGSSSKK